MITKITDGRIVEIYADASYVASHKENLLESYENGTLKDLTGSVIVYDVNYIYLGSLNYKDGKLVPGMSMVRPGGQLPSNKKAGSSVTKTLDCIDWYWVTYYPSGYSTESYAFTTCDGNNEYGGAGGNGYLGIWWR